MECVQTGMCVVLHSCIARVGHHVLKLYGGLSELTLPLVAQRCIIVRLIGRFHFRDYIKRSLVFLLSIQLLNLSQL